MDSHLPKRPTIAATLVVVALFEATMIVERDATVLAVAFGAALTLGFIWRSCLIVMATPVMAIVMLLVHLALVGDVASPAPDAYMDWLTYPAFGTALFLVTAIGVTLGAAAIPATTLVHDHWDVPFLAVREGIHDRLARRRLVNHVRNIERVDFEDIVLTVLPGIGCERIELVDAGSDSGPIVRGAMSDVRGWPIRTVSHLIWSEANVPASRVQEIRAGLAPRECGLIITNRDFTRDARALASHTLTSALVLINGERLVDLMIAQGIGVTEARHGPVVDPA